jgi:hypothetical protein
MVKPQEPGHNRLQLIKKGKIDSEPIPKTDIIMDCYPFHSLVTSFHHKNKDKHTIKDSS